MEVKGNLTVKSIVTAGRRVNEGLIKQVLSGDIELDKYASKNQLLYCAQERTVNLPDATELPLGWTVSFYSDATSSAKVNIEDNTDGPLYTISPSKSVSFILLDNETAAGEWRVIQSGKGGGGGLGQGNVLLYSESDIITPASDTSIVTGFTLPYSDYRPASDTTETGNLAFVFNSTITSGNDTIYVWHGSGTGIVASRNWVVYSTSNEESGFAVYQDAACSVQTPITKNYTIAGIQHTTTLSLTPVTVTSTATTGGFNINPFVANVMDGVDEAGDVVDEIVYLDSGTAISTPATLPASEFYYITKEGLLIAEEFRQRGGNVFPPSAQDGEIFFLKPLRRNYKYDTTNGWEDYPCTAVCEVSWDANGLGVCHDYPKNEWWWDYKYGEQRNTVVVSSGAVLTIPDMTGAIVGDTINGVLVGNFVATVADGYTPAGVAVDIYTPVPIQHAVNYTFGTDYYYYVLPDGSVISSTHGQTSVTSLPESGSITSHTNGDMIYSIKDGRNYMFNGTTYVPYPAVLVASISAAGVGKVYPFNASAYNADLTSYSQTFLNASTPTSSITLDYEVVDPNHLTINVCNTVLQTSAYSIGSDNRTITFTTPVEAGIQIEARWYVPANLTVVRQTDVSAVAVSDFNTFYSTTLYSLVHTTQGVTLHPPLDITADWFVKYLECNGVIYQEASCVGDPACTLVRTYANSTWSDWSFTYAAWYPGS